MIEVFKTNVYDPSHAKKLVDLIHQTFETYEANFDLDDIDNILRVKSSREDVNPATLIELLKGVGFYAEVIVE